MSGHFYRGVLDGAVAVPEGEVLVMSGMKPCPFCGGEAHIKEVVSACEKLYTVGCSDSECMGFETLYAKPTVDEALAAWNRRVGRTCHMDMTEEGEGRYRMWECGECGHSCEDVFGSYEYCPHCGAKVVDE